MARDHDTPTVKTYADHELITPPDRLRSAVVRLADATDDPVARAEAALAELADEFTDWMHAECERLEAARQDAKRDGFSNTTHDALFRAAHDIKARPRLSATRPSTSSPPACAACLNIRRTSAASRWRSSSSMSTRCARWSASRPAAISPGLPTH